MGFLKSVFGSAEIDPMDGKWVESYKNGEWKVAFGLLIASGGVQPIEFSLESCFIDKKRKRPNGNTTQFCILRSVDLVKNNCMYLACSIHDEVDESLNIQVLRSESLSGKLLTEDDWTKGRAYREMSIPGIKNAIKLIKNQAIFNAYSTMPPYVFIITLH